MRVGWRNILIFQEFQYNPFWIYPLDIIEIKHEVSQFFQVSQKHGLIAHFINVLIHVYEKTSEQYIMQKFDKKKNETYPLCTCNLSCLNQTD